MPEYAYDFNKQTSTMVIWEGNKRILIAADITQRRQAKILFQRYLEERKVIYARNN